MAHVKRVARRLLDPPRGTDMLKPLEQNQLSRRGPAHLGHAWPWLSLVLIVCMHPGWTADQIAELLAVFTPYIMLSRSK